MSSDDDSELSDLAPSSTTPSIDPGDSGSVFKATLVAKTSVLPLIDRPKRGGQKRNRTQAQLSISGVLIYPCI
jgi:hypothetical protein